MQRVAHAGLLCIYTLAALLGLNLHSTGEAQTPRHVCDASHPDLERDSGNGPSHDAAQCALCHVFEGFGTTWPVVGDSPALASLERTDVAPPPRRSKTPPASLALVARSRAPPRVLVANA